MGSQIFHFPLILPLTLTKIPNTKHIMCPLVIPNIKEGEDREGDGSLQRLMRIALTILTNNAICFINMFLLPMML